MRVRSLTYVLFSIVICSFEYAKNELYFVNDRGIYLERNVINFRNNRILADGDNEFDLNEFYESTLSLATQLSDCIDDSKELEYLQNIIDSHIKKHKERNTSIDFKNVDSTTKKLIKELRKEIEELKKQINNKRNDELAIQQILDKKIRKELIKAILSYFTFLAFVILIPITGVPQLFILFMPFGLSIFLFTRRRIKCIFKLAKI